MRALWAIKPLRLLIMQVLLIDIGQVAVEIATREPVCHGEVLVQIVTALLGSGTGGIALKAGAGRLVIGHYSSRYKEESVLVEEARTVFPDTHPATEGTTFTIEKRQQP